MANPNPRHQNFISLFRQADAQGVEFLSVMQPLYQQWQLLFGPSGADPITADDFAGGNADTNLADLTAAMNAVGQILATVQASNNAVYVAAVKVLPSGN